MAKASRETVHHPAHYNAGDIEHCEMVEDQGHADGYYFGQVTKYLFRQGLKAGQGYFSRRHRAQVVDAHASLEDLRKAHWYLARWIAWRVHGKKIWKIVRRDPEIVFDPSALADVVKHG